MKISYDASEDTLDLVFSDTAVYTRDLGEGILAQYDGEGQLTRIQIHQPLATAGGRDVFRQIVIEGIGPFPKSEPLIIVPRLFENAQRTD